MADRDLVHLWIIYAISVCISVFLCYTYAHAYTHTRTHIHTSPRFLVLLKRKTKLYEQNLLIYLFVETEAKTILFIESRLFTKVRHYFVFSVFSKWIGNTFQRCSNEWSHAAYLKSIKFNLSGRNKLLSSLER